jgi:hypothetical protein
MLGQKKGGRGRGILGKSVFSSISTQFFVFQGQIHQKKIDFTKFRKNIPPSPNFV